MAPHTHGGPAPARADQPDRLAAATRLLRGRGASPTLDRLTHLAARLLGTAYAHVCLVTDVETVLSASGLPEETVSAPTELAGSVCAELVEREEPLLVGDATTDGRFADLESVAAGYVRSYLGVPLRDSDGAVVGSLCVHDPQPRAWQDEDVTMLSELAAAAAAARDRAAVTAENEAVRMRLEMALGAARIGSFEWDLTVGSLTWDDRLHEIFGVEPGEFPTTAEAFRSRVHPDDLERVEAAVQSTIDHDVAYDEEYRILLPDGRQRWVAARGRVVLDDEGTAVRMVGAAHENTARRTAELEARTSGSLLSLLTKASEALYGSLEVEDAVSELARVVVPTLGDWSVVSLVGTDHEIRDVTSWHRDPELRKWAKQYRTHRLSGMPTKGRIGLVQRSGEPFFIESDTTAKTISNLADPRAIEAIETLQPGSGAAFPVMIGTEVVGVLSIVRDTGRPPMNETEAAAAMDIARRAGVALENARRFGHVRDLSEQLQRSMLTDPVLPEGISAAVRYRPAAQVAKVGGDWYDAFTQADGATMLVIGDVVGHDTAAAAAMGQLRNLMRGIAFSESRGPAAVLALVDTAMQALQIETTATAVVAAVEPLEDGKRRLRWTNAGHPPPVVVHADGRTEMLATDDVLLGIAQADRSETVVELDADATVLMYTDGLFERRGEDLDAGLDRLRETLAELADLPLEDLVDAVLARMLPVELDDDVALVAVRLHAV